MRWVFWGAVALIAYTYVGYPLWLWLRCRLRPKPIQAGSIAPFVSVVMVVRNEERVPTGTFLKRVTGRLNGDAGRAFRT